MFLLTAIFLLTGSVVNALCFFDGDGCTSCSSDGYDVDIRCPDLCGPGRSLTFLAVSTQIPVGVGLAPIKSSAEVQNQVSGCIEREAFGVFLAAKGATIFNFSRQKTAGSTWSCEEVCDGYESDVVPCPLCFGGAAAADLDLDFFTGQTCREAASILFGSLRATDASCLIANAQAYYRCGCPDLPPPRDVPFCSLCPNGTFLSKPDVVLAPAQPGGYRDETCESIATLISYAPSFAGFVPFTSCVGYQNGYSEMCGCSDSSPSMSENAASPMDGPTAAPPSTSGGSCVASMSSWLLICALMTYLCTLAS